MIGERERPVVPRGEPRSYHGRPVLKRPLWTWEIPCYFFAGGLGGASAGLAWVAERRGNDVLARRAWAVSLAGVGASPALLVSDLGRPARFLNMLRMLKVSSPMSVGSWVLSASGVAIGVSAADALLRPLPAARAAKAAAAVLGLPLSTYTGALVANTAVPVWAEGRLALPFLFGSGAAASAGAAGVLATPAGHAGPARRLAIGGAVAELAAARAMERGLGELGEPYRRGAAAVLSRSAKLLSAAGAVALAASARRRPAARVVGASAVLAGALLERWAIYRAGFASVADPAYTVGPQRQRLDATGDRKRA